jgi:predicted nucleic acid-binding Zn ribbon protein
MDAQQKETLLWFVDFANLDLETIKPGEKAKLLVEAKDSLWPPMEAWGKLILRQKPPSWMKIPPKASQGYWEIIRSSQKAVIEALEENITASVPPNDPHEKAIPLITFGYDKMFWAVARGYKFPYKIQFTPITKRQDQYLRLTIFMLLAGCPEHTVRWCIGCNKFFLNPTNREKQFCSAKCLWRVNAERKRKELKENHPQEYEAYLEKQRDTMKRYYDKKTKKKVNPNVKIAPRKKARTIDKDS